MARVKAAGTPSESAEPVAAFVDSEGDFSWNLFRTADAAENVLISPASVYIALAMTLNGADGSTRDAMLRSLSASGISLDQLNAASRDWTTLLMDTDGKTMMKSCQFNLV